MKSKMPSEFVIVPSNGVLPPGRYKPTFAFGTLAPLESITVPVRRPVTCAESVIAATNRTSSAKPVLAIFPPKKIGLRCTVGTLTVICVYSSANQVITDLGHTEKRSAEQVSFSGEQPAPRFF